MFYIRYLTMHKPYMHAGAIRQLMYCSVYLKLADYSPVHTNKPYNNFNILYLHRHNVKYQIQLFIQEISKIIENSNSNQVRWCNREKFL